eukprot:gene9110-1411_t
MFHQNSQLLVQQRLSFEVICSCTRTRDSKKPVVGRDGSQSGSQAGRQTSDGKKTCEGDVRIVMLSTTSKRKVGKIPTNCPMLRVYVQHPSKHTDW